jgi:hypothetical protein
MAAYQQKSRARRGTAGPLVFFWRGEKRVPGPRVRCCWDRMRTGAHAPLTNIGRLSAAPESAKQDRRPRHARLDSGVSAEVFWRHNLGGSCAHLGELTPMLRVRRAVPAGRRNPKECEVAQREAKRFPHLVRDRTSGMGVAAARGPSPRAGHGASPASWTEPRAMCYRVRCE